MPPLFFGAGNRTRTCTSKTEEPKSTESTNSTMPALLFLIISESPEKIKGNSKFLARSATGPAITFDLGDSHATRPAGLYRAQPPKAALSA